MKWALESNVAKLMALVGVKKVQRAYTVKEVIDGAKINRSTVSQMINNRDVEKKTQSVILALAEFFEVVPYGFDDTNCIVKMVKVEKVNDK